MGAIGRIVDAIAEHDFGGAIALGQQDQRAVVAPAIADAPAIEQVGGEASVIDTVGAVDDRECQLTAPGIVERRRQPVEFGTGVGRKQPAQIGDMAGRKRYRQLIGALGTQASRQREQDREQDNQENDAAIQGADPDSNVVEATLSAAAIQPSICALTPSSTGSRRIQGASSSS